MAFALYENGSQLAANVDGQPPAWIVPPAADREPKPPFGYVVSFVRHHERGFAAPASRFRRGLCYHYDVELHNFAPCGARRQDVHFAAGVAQGTLHSLHDDLQQYGVRAGVVLPPQRRARPPYTGKVLREKADSWWHSVSPSSRQDRL
jgi:hypothetical protein